jgi:hypothetical protein
VTASTQAGQSAWEHYRAGERNAEAIARAYQAKQSLEDWRAGERTANAGEKSPIPASTPTSETQTPKSFWQRAGEWIKSTFTPSPVPPPTPPTPTGTPQSLATSTPAASARKKSWWEKALDWIDNHQTAASIGAGALVGAIAIGITLAAVTTVTLPVLAAAVGIATVSAAATVAVGTAFLNAHYDRPLSTNLWSNVKAGAITATVVTGVGLFVAGGLLTQAVIVAGNTIAGTCSTHPAVCANAARILDVVDKVEETALNVQLAVETATNNPHAAETALQLQLEYLDGGTLGNTTL